MAETRYIYGGETSGSYESRGYFEDDQIVHIGSADAEHEGAGTVINITPGTNDTVYVHDSGSLLGVQIDNAGSVSVESGGIVSGLTGSVSEASGTVIVDVAAGGRLFDANVAGGMAYVVSGAGAVASGIDVYSGGVISTYNNALADDVTVNEGGVVELGNSASYTRLTLSSGATFAATGNIGKNINGLIFKTGAEMTTATYSVDGLSITNATIEERTKLYNHQNLTNVLVNANSSHDWARGVEGYGVNILGGNVAIRSAATTPATTTLRNVVISSGGTLSVSSGSIVSGAVVRAGGTLRVFDRAYDVVFERESTAGTIYSGAYVSGVYFDAEWNIASATLNAVTIDASASVRVIGGEITDAEIKGQAFLTTENAVVNNVTASSGGIFIVSGGTVDGIDGYVNVRVFASPDDTATTMRNVTLGGEILTSRTMNQGMLTIDSQAELVLGGDIIFAGGRSVTTGTFNLSAEDATNVVFDLTKYCAQNGDILSTAVFNKLNDSNVNFSVKVDGDMENTYYKLAASSKSSNPVSCDTIELETSIGNTATITWQSGTSGLYYNDYILGKRYSLYQANNSLCISVRDANSLAGVTTAGPVTKVVNNFGDDYTPDHGEKWTDSTAGITGTIFAGDNWTTGNLWLEINTTSSTNAVVFGGGNDNSLAGVVNLNLVNGGVTAVMGGAGNNLESVNGVNLVLGSGASTTLAYGAGRGNVAGNVTVMVSSGAQVTGQLYGGAVLLSAANGGIAIGGDVTLDISGGDFTGDIYGGGRVNGSAGSEATNEVISGAVNINVSGGSFLGAKSIYGGGLATDVTAVGINQIEVIDGVNIVWDGGEISGKAENGRGIFGGAFASGEASTLVEKGVSITVNSGIATNVFGGGWAQGNGVSTVSGDVEITINSGSVSNIFGGGAHADGSNGTTVVDGNVDITIAGDAMTGRVFAGGQVEGDSVTGNATITLSDTASAEYLSGLGYHSAETVAGTSELVFSNYTGTFSGEALNFDKIIISGDSAMTLAEEASISNTVWEFDVSDNNGSAALLTWNEADFAGDTVQINLSNANVLDGWVLADVDDASAFSNTTFELTLNGASLGNVALGEAMFAGVFADYSLYFDESDTALKFAKLA